MQMNVSGHHIEITDSLRGYVESKIEKIERHFDLVSDVSCILTVEKLRHKAEATVKVNGGTIYADATEEDMYAAIDSLTDIFSAVICWNDYTDECFSVYHLYILLQISLIVTGYFIHILLKVSGPCITTGRVQYYSYCYP